MPDPIYTDPRLAVLYDVFNHPRDDLDAHVAIADELGARRVVDLGCGTGTLALRLRGAGRQVVGVDPAGASLDVARAKPGAEGVAWIEGDATAIPTDPRADLVVMTGNAAQAVGDDGWPTLLRHVHAGLAPRGWFTFETRRPERRAWEDWAVSAPVVHDVPGLGAVEQSTDVLTVELPWVSFRHTYRFADGTGLASDSTLRFRDHDELTADLDAAGFVVRDVREAPDRPGRELVVVAQRRDP